METEPRFTLDLSTPQFELLILKKNLKKKYANPCIKKVTTSFSEEQKTSQIAEDTWHVPGNGKESRPRYTKNPVEGIKPLAAPIYPWGDFLISMTQVWKTDGLNSARLGILLSRCERRTWGKRVDTVKERQK